MVILLCQITHFNLSLFVTILLPPSHHLVFCLLPTSKYIYSSFKNKLTMMNAKISYNYLSDFYKIPYQILINWYSPLYSHNLVSSMILSRWYSLILSLLVFPIIIPLSGNPHHYSLSQYHYLIFSIISSLPSILHNITWYLHHIITT